MYENGCGWSQSRSDYKRLSTMTYQFYFKKNEPVYGMNISLIYFENMIFQHFPHTNVWRHNFDFVLNGQRSAYGHLNKFSRS